MNKIPCASQNMEAKTLPTDVCIFGHFGRLSPAAIHSAYCQFDSRAKWWIHVSSNVSYLCKIPFRYIETVANNALNHRYIVVFDRQWANAHPLWTQLSHWQMFMQKGEYTAFWYLQLLCYLMQLQFMIGQKSLWCFLRQLPNLEDLSIQLHLCLYNHV